MNYNNLNESESQNLKQMIASIQEAEFAQVEDLSVNCNNPYQFAKTHSNYVKDWEKVKEEMETMLTNNILPPDTSAAFCRALLDEMDKVYQKKFSMTQMLFSSKFNESIFNYLGADGKTKFLGIF
jgi:hypothetical protein